MRQALLIQDDLLAERQSVQRERAAFSATQAAIAKGDGDFDTVLKQVLVGALQPSRALMAERWSWSTATCWNTVWSRGCLAPHKGLRVPLDGSTSGVCYQTNSAILVRMPIKILGSRKILIGPLDLARHMHAPIVRGNQVLGVLKLQANRPPAFTERDLGLAKLFAGVAIAGLTEVDAVASQRAAAASESRYKAIFESAIDYAIIVLDLNGNVTHWNTGC